MTDQIDTVSVVTGAEPTVTVENIEAALNGPWTRAKQPGIPIAVDDIVADGIACANFGSGVREATAPCGLAGGAGAAPHELWLDHADGTREAVDGNSFYRLARGDRFHIHASGGGGYGDPHHRPAARVLADVRDGVVSPEVARAQYGVAVRTEGAAIDWTVDEAQTAALRGARRQ